MKKTIFYSALLSCLLMASSCGDDFLAVVPEDGLITDTFYKTRAQFTLALNGAYNPLLGLHSGAGAPMYLFNELRSDNTTFQQNADQSQVARKNIDMFLEERNATDGFYTTLFQAIARCNVIIDRVEISDLLAADKTQIKGEASFLRAFYYFQLVKTWGPVPLVLKEVKSYDEALAAVATLSSVPSVYNQIVADAAIAASSLPATYATADRGRVTKYAAKMLLADVYLTQAKYSEALTQLTGTDGVITSNVFSLRPTYAGIWGIANEHNSESIWEINYFQTDVYTAGAANMNSSFHDNFGPNNYTASTTPHPTGGVPLPQNNNLGWGIATPDLMSTFENGDLRKSMIATTYSSGGVLMPYTTKFFSVHNTGLRYGNNWPVYRYAEALLMAAECLNKTGQDGLALPYLNQVRSRAGLLPSAALGTTLSDIIIHERRVEFAHENKRWPDLVRTGTADAVMKAHGIAMKAMPVTGRINGADLNSAGAAYTNIRILFPYPDREAQVAGFVPTVGE